MYFTVYCLAVCGHVFYSLLSGCLWPCILLFTVWLSVAMYFTVYCLAVCGHVFYSLLSGCLWPCILWALWSASAGSSSRTYYLVTGCLWPYILWALWSASAGSSSRTYYLFTGCRHVSFGSCGLHRLVAAVVITVYFTEVCLLVGCLSSQQHASVSQGRICSHNFTCCHTEIEAADQTFYLTQSQYTDTGPTRPSADPVTPGA